MTQPQPSLTSTSTVAALVLESSPRSASFPANEAERRERCMWCWPQRHPNQAYPQSWSSSMCPDCAAAMRAMRQQRQEATA
ncbi:hypothetical protein [Ktedonobacter racemifer]|uniref:Uncharacterized protein n=1 Tax=Ktedonobacter racemifer DSM 44963 TaxID=485913 RepID=D6U8S8_KTERA|nr:hypothetical protein [Ktedonobacter racemifer]EFH79638.1 hypothetical protein Krac_0116 [Ktedonobacter racemifer DSM 44963]